MAGLLWAKERLCSINTPTCVAGDLLARDLCCCMEIVWHVPGAVSLVVDKARRWPEWSRDYLSHLIAELMMRVNLNV